tara:strand:- start:4 stop:438 length:435 start_codon:yes stop_codon:yes gene_type:complete
MILYSSFVLAILSLTFSVDTSDILYLEKDIIHNFIEKANNQKKEFIITLKDGEKFRVSEVLSIDGNTYQFNILANKMSRNIFYKNNISRRSNYYNSQNSKVVVEVNLNDILSVEKISYINEFKEIRNYTLIVVGMYFIFSVFSN